MLTTVATPPSLRLYAADYVLDHARRDADYDEVADDARCAACAAPGLSVVYFRHRTRTSDKPVIAQCRACGHEEVW